MNVVILWVAIWGLALGTISLWRVLKDRRKRPSTSPSPGPSSSQPQSGSLSLHQNQSPPHPSPSQLNAWLNTPTGQAWLRLDAPSSASSTMQFPANPGIAVGRGSCLAMPGCAAPAGHSGWCYDSFGTTIPFSPWFGTGANSVLPSEPRLNHSGIDSLGKPEPKQGYVWGYRCWYLKYELRPRHWDVMGKTIQGIGDIQLCPIGMLRARNWQPGVNLAECHRTLSYDFSRLAPHSVPQEGCMCGFWCLHNLNDAIAKCSSSVPDDVPPSYVVGSVVGMGKAIRHTDGWRSEKAMVVAFMVPQVKLSPETIASASDGPLREHVEVLKALSQRWDVPFVEKDQMESFTKNMVDQMWGRDSESD